MRTQAWWGRGLGAHWGGVAARMGVPLGVEDEPPRGIDVEADVDGVGWDGPSARVRREKST